MKGQTMEICNHDFERIGNISFNYSRNFLFLEVERGVTFITLHKCKKCNKKEYKIVCGDLPNILKAILSKWEKQQISDEDLLDIIKIYKG